MLDNFPIELIYEVFQYLTGEEILDAFKGLNQRLDALFERYNRYHLDFRLCSKSKFNFVRQSIPPDQIQSLILSDADDTCGQITRFFHLFSIRQFINLRSLSLMEISEHDLQILRTEFHLCPRLSSLTIRLAQGFIPKITGLSLKHLSIGVCTMNMLQEILSSMPNLITLDVQLVKDWIFPNKYFCVSTAIRRLKIDLPEPSYTNYDDIGIFMQCMPKLEEFTLITVRGFKFVKNNRWEHLLRHYSPRLKRFHFVFHPTLDNPDTNQIFAAFRTPLWLKENPLIIGCNCASIEYDDNGPMLDVYRYSLSPWDEQWYSNSSTSVAGHCRKEGLLTDERLYLLCEDNHNSKLADYHHFSKLNFRNTRNAPYLQPIDELFDLSRLQHLIIHQSNSIDAEVFFSNILMRATHLESLELSWQKLTEITNRFRDQRVCSLLSKQIKYLNVLKMKTPEVIPSNGRMEKLIELFGENLEKLKFSVISINDILIVLNQMRKLSSVAIECNTFERRMSHKQVLLWMMRNVPRLTSFTHRFRRISDTRVALFLWIGD